MNDVKPWMINQNMWASGIKANKWQVPEAWEQLIWFVYRKPEQWTTEQVDYFDYSYVIMLQQNTGWN